MPDSKNLMMRFVKPHKGSEARMRIKRKPVADDAGVSRGSCMRRYLRQSLDEKEKTSQTYEEAAR